jgi:hypothetical protein
MWIVTKAGFYSAVQKFNSDDLTIRARVRADLVRLLDYLPGPRSSYKITATPQHDYEYRLICSHEDWADALANLGSEVDYDNFKSEIGRKDPRRESVLHRVWGALFGLSDRTRRYSSFLDGGNGALVPYTGPSSYTDPTPVAKSNAVWDQESLWESDHESIWGQAQDPSWSLLQEPLPVEEPVPSRKEDPEEDIDAWLDSLRAPTSLQ